MNNKYTITFKGNTKNIAVAVAYGDNGTLRSVDFGEQEINTNALSYCYANIPVHETELGQIGYMALVEAVPQDLSFNTFWEAYGNKMNKDRAYKLWTALPDTDRIAALRAIKKYDQYLAQKPGMEKKYPDTWLKNRSWNDNYKIR